jgi:cell division protein FtsN
MTRDMKPRKTQPPKKKSAGGTLIGMFIGLVLGVGIAAGVVFYLNKSPLPFANKAVALPKTESSAPAVAKTEKSGTSTAQTQPLSLPGKPGDPIPEKRFQFYDILPGKADAVPDKAGKPTAVTEEAKKDDGKESKQALFLQAGSFSTAQDADNQKAKLAFMGMEALVQQVMVQDKTFYRVRVGPYNKIEELNKVRAELAKAGIEAQLAKNKE